MCAHKHNGVLARRPREIIRHRRRRRRARVSSKYFSLTFSTHTHKYIVWIRFGRERETRT